MTFKWRQGAAIFAALALAGLGVPSAGFAQEEVTVLSSGGAPGQPDLDLTRARSLFDIQAEGDEGAGGVRTNGTNVYCVQNIVGFASRNNFGCGTGWRTRRSDGQITSTIFDMGMAWGAPPGDLPSVIDPNGSMIGGGYTMNITTLIIGGAVRGGGNKLWASDRTSAELLSLGVRTTDDASCTNHSANQNGGMNSGFQLLPESDCPPTHPPSGWAGARPIESDSYLELQATHPDFGPSVDNDPFAFWRVPTEMQRTDKFLGDYQTYGELSDFYLQGLGRYGNVVPGGTGDPTYHGWPLGLTQKFDVFYFGLPSVGNTMFFQSTIVNESELVYGVGMTYDSVYIGINVDPLLNGSQGDAVYFDPTRSIYAFQDTGLGCANAPDPPGSGCSNNPALEWQGGAPGAAIVVLKSPIGDQRYKLFSDPSSDFFDPTHPRAGDTITFQHQRTCGFGDCIPRTWTRSQRAHFGLFTSTGQNVLDGETPGDLTDRQYHRIFRPELWPERTGQFNKYVPGVDDAAPVWDWNHDGVPDTIYADSCGSRGCVQMWGDTLPSGYTNSYSNISYLSVGPVHMAPYDTVAWVVALIGAADSTTMETAFNSTIDFYNGFFLGPESAPAPRITAVDIVPGGDRNNSVTLLWDDTTEEWEDPFLGRLDVSPEVALNPWITDSIQGRISNNVAALYIFKSCDGGTSYTNDADCDGDPVQDPTSKWSGFGWQPYATLNAGANGELPNTFTDNTVTAGITHTYVVLTETRGANFNLVRGATGAFSAEMVSFAPSLLGALSSSGTNPNVAIAYVPVNLAAGAKSAEFTELSRSGSSTVPVNVNVVGTAPTSGDFRALFVDSIQVVQTDVLEANGSVISTSSEVTGFSVRTVSDGAGGSMRQPVQNFTFSRSGTVTRSGLSLESSVEAGGSRLTTHAGGFGMILASSSGAPLLTSTTLSGSAATPGSFFGRSDFPFFTMNIDASQGGSFGNELYLGTAGDTITAQVQPAISWRRGGGLSEYLSGDQYGTYELTWVTDAFGTGFPFRIDQRATVASSYQSAVSARQAASTSSTSAEDLDAVMAADGNVSMDAADLVAYNLPFTIRNVTYGRDVDVVVTSHQETVLLGQANDSLRVDVPAGQWVPGDVLHLVETITREVVDADGNTVLDAGGQPTTETVRVGTFRAVIGCLAPRNSCDPTLGGALNAGYVAFQPNTVQRVAYFVPLRSGDEVQFQVTKAVTTDEALALGTGSADSVHVVPNPYIFATEFERQTTDRVVKFTKLPPEGRIRIFDLAGRFVQEINYEAEDLRGGDLDWNLQTREGLDLAGGLYIWVLETDRDKQMGKFVVIR